MRRALSDRKCLAVARRALAEHLATRPAAPEEILAQADAHERRAETCAAASAEMRRGRGERDIMLGQDLGRCAAEEARERARARDLRTAAALPAGEPWTRTRLELEGRVAYYEGLVAATEVRQ